MVDYTVTTITVKAGVEPIRFSLPWGLTYEIREWCTDMFGDQQKHAFWWLSFDDVTTNGINKKIFLPIFYFIDKEDAALFKLRWM